MWRLRGSDLEGQPEPKNGSFDILLGDFVKVYEAIQQSPHYNTQAPKYTKIEKLFRTSRKTISRWRDKFIPTPSKRQKSGEPSQEADAGRPQELAPPAIVPPSLPSFGTSSQLVPPPTVPQVPATNTLSQPPAVLNSTP